VDGLIRLVEAPDAVTGPLNLGTPAEFTIYELAEMVIALTGSCSRVIRMPLPTDDPKKRRPDISKAQELLGWHPRVALREGLMKTIDYFKQVITAK
jgi:UDP-glucuronate decarboxylase